MAKPTLADLTAFAAIVAHRSFRKAAGELEVSPSTLSHMMRALENRVGLRLLHRTTRSVAPTEAGERLIGRLRPVLRDLDDALAETASASDRLSGTLRINASEGAARLLLGSVVPGFLKHFPEMSLDIVTDGRLVDIVAEGFDAGVRLREAVPQDMIAVPFGGPTRFMVVASPAYLAARPRPRTPDDLKDHACIRVRMPSGKLYRWEFEKRGETLTVEVPGVLTLDHIDLMADAAQAGLGLAYVPDHAVRPQLATGALVSVLEDWCPDIGGLCLSYPGHRHVPPGLRAFIDLLSRSSKEGSSSFLKKRTKKLLSPDGPTPEIRGQR